MDDPRETNRQSNSDQEIDLQRVWQNIVRRKVLVLAVTVVFGVIGAGVSLLLPNEYRVDALLAPVAEKSGNSGLMASLAGIASLAGLSSVDSGSNVNEAIAILKSRQFISEFVVAQGITVPLFATRSEPVTGRLYLDPMVYDSDREQWTRASRFNTDGMPTEAEIHQAFNSLMSVVSDAKTGLVTVSLEWFDPVQAKGWLVKLIRSLNDHIRARDIEEARRSIDFLQKRIQESPAIELQNTFFSLIESQTKTIMLADSRDEYVFRVIDAPVIPLERQSPNRLAIVALSAGAGLFLIVSLVVIAGNRRQIPSGSR